MKVIIPNTKAARMAKLMLPKIYCKKNGLIVSRVSAELNRGMPALVIQNLPQTRLRNKMGGIKGGMLILANRITSGLFNLNKKASVMAVTSWKPQIGIIPMNTPNATESDCFKTVSELLKNNPDQLFPFKYIRGQYQAKARKTSAVLSMLMRVKSWNGLKCETRSSFGKYRTDTGTLSIFIPFQASRTNISISNSNFGVKSFMLFKGISGYKRNPD